MIDLLSAVPQVGDKQRLLRLLRSAADAPRTLDAGSVQLLQLLGWKASGGQPLRRPTDNDATNLQLALAVSALDYAIFREGADNGGGGGGGSNEPAPAAPAPAALAHAPSAGDCVVLKGISRSYAVSDDDVVEMTMHAGKRPRQHDQEGMDLAPTPPRRAPSLGSSSYRGVVVVGDVDYGDAAQARRRRGLRHGSACESEFRLCRPFTHSEKK